MNGGHTQTCGCWWTVEQERGQVLLDQRLRLTPKEPKPWSHDEIAPLNLSMSIEHAEDESGRGRSRGEKVHLRVLQSMLRKNMAVNQPLRRRWAHRRRTHFLMRLWTTGDVWTRGGTIQYSTPVQRQRGWRNSANTKWQTQGGAAEFHEAACDHSRRRHEPTISRS